jgi:hypothetical protein
MANRVICLNPLDNLDMKNAHKSISFRLALAIAAGLAASAISSRAQDSSATISGVAAGGGEFDYTITLENTAGSGDIEGFWYGWIAFDFDLPTTPSNPGNSLGWNNSVDGDSIQWQGGSGDALAPGQTGTFTFESTSTPSQITTTVDGDGTTSGDSVTYSGTINPGGASSPNFEPTLVAAPEPSAWELMVGGLFIAAGLRKYLAVRRTLRA